MSCEDGAKAPLTEEGAELVLGLERFPILASYAGGGEEVRVSAWVCSVARLSLALCGPMDCSPQDSSVHGIFPGKNIGVGCHFLLQGIFPTLGLNLHILCHLH